jgi:hypothetical protein
MKKIGFLSFGHWTPSPQSQTRSASDASCNRSTWPSQPRNSARTGLTSACITSREVRQFEERHPIGTKARLALALMLYLGVRRGDVVTLGRQHVKDGWLRLVPRKTRYKRLEVSEKPVLPVLAEVIAASPLGDMTSLVTNTRGPSQRRASAHCFARGVTRPTCRTAQRKAGATIAAENGATDRQLSWRFTTGRRRNTRTSTLRQPTENDLRAKRQSWWLARTKRENRKSHSIVPLSISQRKTRGNYDDWQEWQLSHCCDDSKCWFEVRGEKGPWSYNRNSRASPHPLSPNNIRARVSHSLR